MVDCRPVEHFSSGHLPGSYNLDANLVSYSAKSCNHFVALNANTVFTVILPPSLYSFFTLRMISQWQQTDCVLVSRGRGQIRGSICVSWALGGNKRTSMSTWWWPSSYRKLSPTSVWQGVDSWVGGVLYYSGSSSIHNFYLLRTTWTVQCTCTCLFRTNFTYRCIILLPLWGAS